MPTLTFEPDLTAHVAGALDCYVERLREHQAATPSKAEKASYERTIADIRRLRDELYAQS